MSAHNVLKEIGDAAAGGGRVLVVIGASDAVPASAAGYSKGCILIKPGDNAYKNVGTVTSCDFKAISNAA